jgi:hypothetical protein
MSEFIAVVERRESICCRPQLLDGTLNMSLDAIAEFERPPSSAPPRSMSQVAKRQSGIVWDDHATPAPPQVFELLERLRRARPKAHA